MNLESVIQIKCIDHIVLRTQHMDAMLTFYCDVLGCSVERRTPAEEGLIQLRAGSALIDLVDVNSLLGKKGGDAPSTTGHNLDHLCLQIKTQREDVLINYLKQHNITCGDIETRYGAEGYGPSMYIQDPDGNTVELRL